MPFTPFHLGPGAAFKAVGGRHFSFMVFGGSQALMDIEPLVRMIRGDAAIHGLSHTVLGATLIGLVAAVIGKPIGQFVLQLLSIPHYPFTWLASFSGAFVGTLSHVALDTVMHVDVTPYAPWAGGNPFHGMIPVGDLHIWCIGLGFLGGFGVYARYRLHKKA